MEINTHVLPPPIREQDHYVLRRAPWQDEGLSIWIDFEGASILVQDDLPASADEDFATYLDEVREEAASLLALARDFPS